MCGAGDVLQGGDYLKVTPSDGTSKRPHTEEYTRLGYVLQVIPNRHTLDATLADRTAIGHPEAVRKRHGKECR